MSEPIIVSAVVFRDRAGRVLTVRKRGTSRFMLVGGKPEPGESPIAAARREVAEEIGIVLGSTSLRLLGRWEAPAANEPDRVVRSTVFVCDEALTDAPTPHAEIEQLRWLDLSAPLPHDLAPLLRACVIPALRAEGGAAPHPRGRTRRPQMPPPLRPGQSIAVLSPSVAAPAINAELHERACRRLTALTGAPVVEYPTTRLQGADPAARARDIEAAFADPTVGAIIATLGGFDEETVIRQLDLDCLAAHPTRFLGYSDNTHLLNAAYSRGVAGFYGGSTQVHLGPGPEVDELHARALTAALTGGVTLEITDPATSEDYGVRWEDPRCMSETGPRAETSPDEWMWDGADGIVTGHTWGGCLETLQDVLAGKAAPTPADVEGAIILLEASERLSPPERLAEIVDEVGRAGLLEGCAGVLVARPPTSNWEFNPTLAQRAAMREAVYVHIGVALRRYTQAPVVCGAHFGHTRPQWILPYGGTVTIDGPGGRVSATY